MFDTININLRSIDTQQLNFVKTVTRDLNVDTTTSRYGTTYTSHIDNLTIRTTTQGVSIGNGSLCKFLYGNNIVNFTRTDTRLAFEKLSDTLHISLNNATVSRMDVAYNFEVTHPPESYFYHLGNLPYYKRLEQMFYKGVEGLYYSSVSDKKQLVFYDKIKETTNRKDYVPPEYQNKNLLRYELRLKNHIKQIFKVNKVTVPMLYDVQFYNRIVDYWRSVYQNIVKVNEYEIDIADCKGIRDLNKIGILLLVEQQEGMNEFFKKLDQQYNTGRLDKRQRSEIKRQTKELMQNKSIGVVRSPLIEELNTLVEGV